MGIDNVSSLWVCQSSDVWRRELYSVQERERISVGETTDGEECKRELEKEKERERRKGEKKKT